MSKFAFRKETSPWRDRDITGASRTYTFSSGDVSGNVNVAQDGDTLHVHNIQAHDSEGNEAINKLGSSHVREIYKGLKEHHPDAKYITGMRVTGARSNRKWGDEETFGDRMKRSIAKRKF